MIFPVKYVISCVLVCNGEARHPDHLNAPEQQELIHHHHLFICLVKIKREGVIKVQRLLSISFVFNI